MAAVAERLLVTSLLNHTSLNYNLEIYYFSLFSFCGVGLLLF